MQFPHMYSRCEHDENKNQKVIEVLLIFEALVYCSQRFETMNSYKFQQTKVYSNWPTFILDCIYIKTVEKEPHNLS